MFATVLQQCLRSTSMKVPKILPWLANRAGISEDLALELWRCAARETEMSIADCDSSDYYGRAIARLVDLAESEGKQSVVHGTVGGETRLSCRGATRTGSRKVNYLPCRTLEGSGKRT
jgi:hypothetical protein